MDYSEIIKKISDLPEDEKIEQINNLKLDLHEISPFKGEPVDCVLWVKNTEVEANYYNPNSVATPEMELLRTSIINDGYTQPIVAFPEENKYTVVDGFHRNRVGKECRNDWWCKGLGLTQPKSEAYGKYLELKKHKTEAANV
jgi:ParB-like chromosome segregation protein Spo0J